MTLCILLKFTFWLEADPWSVRHVGKVRKWTFWPIRGAEIKANIGIYSLGITNINTNC